MAEKRLPELVGLKSAVPAFEGLPSWVGPTASNIRDVRTARAIWALQVPLAVALHIEMARQLEKLNENPNIFYAVIV